MDEAERAPMSLPNGYVYRFSRVSLTWQCLLYVILAFPYILGLCHLADCAKMHCARVRAGGVDGGDSKQALVDMAQASSGRLQCPRTGETFELSQVHKVYVS